MNLFYLMSLFVLFRWFHCSVSYRLKHELFRPPIRVSHKTYVQSSLQSSPSVSLEAKSNKMNLLTKHKHIVVFDIDYTLAGGCTDIAESPHLEKHGPFFSSDYFFPPNWKIIFDYLLKNKCLIAIFSAGIEERNIPLMDSFLTKMFGQEKYEQLKSKGQFEVFSRQHLYGHGDFSSYGKKVMLKVLSILAGIKLKKSDTDSDDDFSKNNGDDDFNKENYQAFAHKWHLPINNTILIDDVYPGHLDFEKQFIYMCDGIRNADSFVLGIFMTYFEDSEHNNKTLREFVGEINFNYHVRHKFVARGLREIRKTEPDAVYHDRLSHHFPPDQFRSVEYLQEVLCDVKSGKHEHRKPSNGNMKLLRKQLMNYYNNEDPVVKEMIEVLTLKD